MSSASGVKVPSPNLLPPPSLTSALVSPFAVCHRCRLGEASGVDQPKVSALFRGRLREFSIERLLWFLNALHRDVRIVVGEKPQRRRGRVIVEAA